MTMERVPMTIEGFRTLETELQRLKSEERPRIIQAISEARSHGDLSENAEYHAAKEQQGFNEARVADIEDRIVPPVRELEAMGFKIIATRGTKRHLEANGIACEAINKVLEGRPHIVDAMKNGDVHLVFNTTEGAKALADSKDIRRTALLHHIPYYTTVAGAVAVTRAIKALKAGTLRVAPLQSFVNHPS